MKLIIDIDDETYNDIKKGKIYSSFRDVPLESTNAIANGTPLPKGHGRLIDADELNEQEIPAIKKDGVVYVKLSTLQDLIDNAQTIIEADKKERSEE